MNSEIIIIFTLVYAGMIVGGIPGFMLDRAGIALLGAIAMIAFGFLSENEAWNSISVSTICLLFGLMILSAHLHLSGAYTALARRITRLKMEPNTLLAVVVALSGILSSLLTNDVIALAMAPVIVEICIARRYNPVPFLLAVACSVNAGAAMTMIGSPQSMLIAQSIRISFIEFTVKSIVPAAASLVVIWLMFAWMFRKRMEIKEIPLQDDEAPESVRYDAHEVKKGVIVGILLLLGFIFSSVRPEVIALVAGGVLLVNRQYKTDKIFGLVDWHLLVMFIGLFVVNAAFAKTHLAEHWIADLKAHGVDLTAIGPIFFITSALSDIVNNVPAVMLLIPFAKGHADGIAMNLASTLSSNLIVTGSMANIIVIDAAARCGISISFKDHFKYCAPVAVVTLLIAFAWVMLI